MTLSEQLAACLGRSVGAADRQRAALHLVDWLGCALAGTAEEPFRIARTVLGSTSGPAPLIGGGRTTAPDAAYLNGIPGNVLEMDDVHRRAILHPGPTVIASALACVTDATAPRLLLDALVRGYDAVIRIGRALGPAHYAFFHNTATAGPFGAAAAAGTLLNLDTIQLVSAFGNAGTVAAGLWQCRHEPVMTKQLHTAHAAHAGVMAALLAKQGFTGPRALLDGPQGFFAALCPDGDPDEVCRDAAGPWLIHEVSFKPWPACRHAHAVIDAARVLKPQLRGLAIAAIDIGTYRDAINFCDKPDPRTVGEAKFSLQHAAAVALLRARPELEDFGLSRIGDRAFAALRNKTSVAAVEPFAARYPAHFGARVEITLVDGARLEAQVDDALGDPENPLADADLLAKARTLMASAGVAPEQIEALIAATLDLPVAQSITTFLSALDRARPAIATE